MPLQPPVERKPLHHRQIFCEGFLRDDGLWDIDARLVDTKSYAFANQDRGGSIAAGEALHDLCIRLTLDDDRVIQAAQAVSDKTPYHYCQQAGDNMHLLVGIKIGPGWMRKVTQLIGGRQGCTHLTEMLKSMATVAYQTMGYKQRQVTADKRRPHYLDTCRSYASDSPVVLREWPEFYTGQDKD